MKSATLISWLVAWAALIASAAAQEDATEATVLTGRAVDHAGEPVAGASVALVSTSEFLDTAAILRDAVVRTDGEGRFTVTASRTTRLIVIAKPGHQSWVQSHWATEPESRELETAVLPPGGTLTGRIRGREGAPVHGARLRVSTPTTDHFVLIPRIGCMAGARSNDEGIFVVPGVPRTGSRVTVAAPGYRTRSLFAAQHMPLDLTLEWLGFVRGRVVDAEGAAVEGASISADGAEAQAHLPGGEVESGADGAFAVTVPCEGWFWVGASSAGPPVRFGSSEILTGPADDVVIRIAEAPAPPVKDVEIRVIDDATGDVIPRFHATSLGEAASEAPQLAMLQHYSRRQPYESGGRIPVDGAHAVMIEATGHAWTVARVPDDLSEPWTIGLGPEASVTGRVLRAGTGKPIAGAAVRALPVGKSSGSGQDPRQTGVVTGADGRYRVAGLKPGAYHVQVLPPGEAASDAYQVTTDVGTPGTCDISVPEPSWLEFSFRGEVPPRLPCFVQLAFSGLSGSEDGFFDYAPWIRPASLPLSADHGYKLGPVGRGQHGLQIWIPSRVTVGAGTTIHLPHVDPTRGPIVLDLPELATEVARGRVVLPAGVPGGRIAVAARRVAGARRRDGFEEPLHRAELGVDGAFAIDLPHGSYTFQLADMETGILFHTDAAEVVVEPGMDPLRIQPAIHWLRLDLDPARAKELYVSRVGVELPRPREGGAAFLEWSSSSPTHQGRTVSFDAHTARRWLVPEGVIELTPTLDSRRLGGGQRDSITLDAITVDVDQPEQAVTWRAPPDAFGGR